MHTIDVIIPSWNGKSLLPHCLLALRNQTRKPDGICVIDNGSYDGTAEFLATEWEEVRVLHMSENMGFAAAVQAGIEASTATFVAILNNDARPHAHWIEVLERSFEWPQVGACASVIVTPDNTVESCGLGFSHFGVGHRLWEGLRTDDLPWCTVEVFGASGGAAMFNRQAVLEAGGFDPSFFAQDEDIDLAFRLRYEGYACLLNPGAVVTHLGSQTLRRMPGRFLPLAQRNLEWVFWLNFPYWTWPFWGVLHIFYQVASLMRHTFQGNGKVVLRAKIDALAAFPSMQRKRSTPRRFRKVILPWLGSESKPWRPDMSASH